MTSAPLIIGIGNPLRSDDGIGLAIAGALKETSLPPCRIETCRGDNLDLVAQWKGCARVILIDAMSTPSVPLGSVKVFLAHDQPLPAGFEKSSTHGLGPHEAIELARAFGDLPAYLAVVAVNAEKFEMGETLTEAVAQAIPEALRIIKTLLGGTDA